MEVTSKTPVINGIRMFAQSNAFQNNRMVYILTVRHRDMKLLCLIGIAVLALSCLSIGKAVAAEGQVTIHSLDNRTRCAQYDELKVHAPLLYQPCFQGGARVFRFKPNGNVEAQAPGRSGESQHEPYRDTGMCLDAAGGGGNDGDVIQFFPCHSGANQQWHLTPDGFLKGINGLCMDVGADSSLILSKCNGAVTWEAVKFYLD